MSDDEMNVEKLSAAIGRLDSTQHIKPASRAAEGASDAADGALPSVLQLLERTGDHAQLGATVRRLRASNATLRKPLERHAADKIERAVGFEEVKVKLDRWNAIVATNRAAECKQFPLLDQDERLKEPADAYLRKYTIKSTLEMELDDAPAPPAEEKVFPLTMAEMLEHRKEVAKLRAKQSYREAKARRQSKIKSKKFHRIQRKERTKEQLKEFEILQKTNPEEALRKLEQLEKTRAEERVTLRHKSTGQWAKNKLVRAKYDKETRQQLAEQLAISRDLTKKINLNEDSASDEEMETQNGPECDSDPFNPWIRQVKNDDEVEVSSSYKKYWEEEKKKEIDRADSDEDSSDAGPPSSDEPTIKSVDACESVQVVQSPRNVRRERKTNKKIASISTTQWKVVSTDDTEENQEAKEDIDTMFDELVSRNNQKLIKKFDSINKKITKNNNIISKNTQKRSEESELSKLSFKTLKKKPLIDEEMNETTSDRRPSEKNNIPIKTDINNSNTLDRPVVDTIDPEKFVAAKPKHLVSALPDMDTGDDYMDDALEKRRMTIAEAFEDDDIVADFRKEKRTEIEKSKPPVDDSFMPGWGSWTGKNMVNATKRRRRRFIRAPKNIPRKDDKKPNLIVCEDANEKLKQHLVSELPFPFTSVSDFESTIRAPLGNTFIPEKAHKKLTKPAVIVKTGVIIKPMNESHLIDLKRDKRKKAMSRKK